MLPAVASRVPFLRLVAVLLLSASAALAEPPTEPRAVAGGRLCIRGEQHLFAIGVPPAS